MRSCRLTKRIQRTRVNKAGHRRRSKKPRGRDINGILVLDKQAGVTSNGALQVAKRMFGAAKAGHTGSLDPLATGVLPLCFGEATKFSQFLLDSDKRYLTRIKLGVTTETGDADGEVVEEAPVPALSEADLEAVLAQFRGEISQVPSMYSALKHEGQPLYKLAREGIVVDRPARQITIFDLTLAEFSENELVLDVTCSKGTYIRTLAEDIGKVLGCGAHVTELRRLAAGPFTIECAKTLDDLGDLKTEGGFDALDQLILPVSEAVGDWPEVVLPELTAGYFRQGQPVQVAKAPVEGWIRIFQEATDGEEKKFLGVGEIAEDGKVAPRKLVALP
ncbi:MAG: tRNA pseudouridine(55) synthase TruB [Pseudomonadales bacterium]|nr:tRNA pseudouridine(55) synthase TruB [Pseudomonadales bacterium]